MEQEFSKTFNGKKKKFDRIQIVYTMESEVFISFVSIYPDSIQQQRQQQRNTVAENRIENEYGIYDFKIVQ